MRFRAVLLLLAGTLFSACSSRHDGRDLAVQLKSVDEYIKTGQPEDAVALLKKAEKHAFSVNSRIGVYRRYILLGDVTRAEAVLQRARKALRDNLELSAVYAHFLLRQNRIDDALSVSASLRGSAYGSLYSEAMLKKQSAGPEQGVSVFLQDTLVPVYIDAYNGTGDDHWLRDSAVVYLAVGNYVAASTLQPAKIQGAESAYFWGLVQYDAGNYGACLNALSVPATGTYVPQMTALASDAYIKLGDAESAENLRAPQINAWLHRIIPEIPCELFVNSALWSWMHEDYKRAYDLILTAVTTFPDNVPALVTYANLAFEQTKEPERTDLEETLRKTALRTKRMADYDARPKMLVSDALHRMSVAIEALHSRGESVDDSLLASHAVLEMASLSDMVATSRLAYIWKQLEANELSRNLYPPRLVQLAVHELLMQGRQDEARSLFENYLDARYGLSADSLSIPEEIIQTDVFGGEKRIPSPVIPVAVLYAAFGDRAAQHVHAMDVWEGETAAYFALLDKNVAAARRLYEYVLYEAGSEARAEVASAANLAVICSSTGESQRALELYGQAAGRCRDNYTKSLILYRTAVLQAAAHDISAARLSLDYSLALNPANADARLLRTILSK
ncbi:MAG: hypothetical protein K6G80_07550 [Treponema sp.]|nr:hypothetical protein [Treponema sp.]